MTPPWPVTLKASTQPVSDLVRHPTPASKEHYGSIALPALAAALGTAQTTGPAINVKVAQH